MLLHVARTDVLDVRMNARYEYEYELRTDDTYVNISITKLRRVASKSDRLVVRN
jgi:hypothetical protein